MPHLSPLRTCLDALRLITCHARPLLLGALPLLALHSYLILVTTPLMRVAFVNSFLKPDDALQRGGYEVRMLAPNLIVPGPGYDFPKGLTQLVYGAEVIALTVFLFWACRRLLAAGRRPQLAGRHILAYGLSFAALLVGLLVLTVAFAIAIGVLGAKLGATGHLVGLLAIAVYLWLVLKIAPLAPALATGDMAFVKRHWLATWRVNGLQTLGLAGMLALAFGAIVIIPANLELAIFGFEYPMGFRGRQIFAMIVMQLQFWAQLVFMTAVFCVLYARYRPHGDITPPRRSPDSGAGPTPRRRPRVLRPGAPHSAAVA
jgi:hypothetical protein